MIQDEAERAGEVTRLLKNWHEGDEDALGRLIPMVYEELRRLADRYLRKESDALTLQPTALVHEAYVRMADLQMDFDSRLHFYGVAAGVMRRVLVDLARRRHREKRGGGERPVSLDGLEIAAPVDDMLTLDLALKRLEAKDERKARAMELRYFAGLSNEEVATVLGVSCPTIERDLRMAKAWLLRHLKGPSADIAASDG